MNWDQAITSVGGTHPFADELRRSCENAKEEELAWVDKLIKEGVKAAHPDDGWVKREISEVHFCYPYFLSKIEIDSVIVLGTPEEFRRCRVVEIRESIFQMVYYKFVEIT